MSKYETLWNYIKGSDKNNLKLAYDEIKNICYGIILKIVMRIF